MPDLVVNNAGIGAGGRPVGETPLDDWRRTLGVNLWGVIHGCHVFAPAMREAGRGGIINVASAAGFTAAPQDGAVQRQQGRRGQPLGDAGRRAVRHRRGRDRALPDVREDQHLLRRADRPEAARLAGKIARVAGFSPRRVARTTLDAHDRGRLYVVPQPDAQLLWRSKRLLPGPYTRMAGLLGRFTPDPEV